MAKDLFISALLDVYGEFLNEKQRELVDCYYNEDLSLSEIAENVGITRQGVRDSLKRAELQLKNLEEHCGYCKKFLDMKRLAATAKTDSDSLLELLSIIEGL